jgi:nitrite reductase (NO-forming)
MRAPTRTHLTALAVVAVLAAASCSSDDLTADEAAATTQAATDTAAPPDPGTSSTARRVKVVADGLAFRPGDLTFRAGEAVEIELSSVDIVHNFTIDELGQAIEADAGETTTGDFTPTEPGRFAFYCSIPGHRAAGMEGEIVVEP